MSDLHFTKEQRLILANQYEILKHVNPEMKEYYERSAEIIMQGYSYLYDGEFQYIDDEVPEEVCKTVYDVLSMYRALYWGYANLTPSERETLEERNVLFKGFDGNEEIPHYVFAKFVVEQYDGYSELKELIGAGKVDMNSHWPELARYNKMLGKWLPMRSDTAGKQLTLEQIKLIIGKK